jgi:[acyl-carrier-protein] S-malonyltransferase
MGKDLYDSSPAAKAVFDRAGDEIKRWCFEAGADELRMTRVTQPAVFAMTMAAYAAFVESASAAGFECANGCRAPQGGGAAEAGGDAEAPGGRWEARLAGFSLGECSALAAAGCFESFEAALALVRKRGAHMAEAGFDAEGNLTGGMAALACARPDAIRCIESAAEGGVLEAANFNSPGQTVAAGSLGALARLRKKAKEAGFKALPLKVSAAFHSSMMKPAAERLAADLEAVGLRAPRAMVYANLTGKDIMDGKPAHVPEGEWLKGRMAAQVMNPVHWQETIENMAGDGVGMFVELGPGKTLAGLAKKTAPGVEAVSVEDAAGLAAAVDALKALSGI